MVYKYVMLGAPSQAVFGRQLFTSSEQFFKSWYIFFFQAPYLPEFTMAMNDYKMFKSTMCGADYTETVTEQDIEAYKYTFAKPGLCYWLLIIISKILVQANTNV